MNLPVCPQLDVAPAAAACRRPRADPALGGPTFQYELNPANFGAPLEYFHTTVVVAYTLLPVDLLHPTDSVTIAGVHVRRAMQAIAAVRALGPCVFRVFGVPIFLRETEVQQPVSL